MSIRPLSGGFAGSRSADMFVSMRRELDEMQRRLATGKIAETYGGLGFERRTSLDMRGKMAMLSGYENVIEHASLRMKVMAQVAERLDGMAGETRSDLRATGFEIGGDGRTMAQRLAEQRLREALDNLNKDLNGRFLFAGRSADAAPVEGYDLIMNGDSTRAGLKTLIDERTRADLGVGGLGRLTLSVDPPVPPAVTPDTVRLAGNNPALPFGFRIANVTATSPGGAITSAFAAGPPEDAAFTLSAPPSQGDKIRVELLDPDGVSHVVELTARTVLGDNDRQAFQIGADVNATITDPKGLRAMLERAIQDKATAVLTPRAAILAAEEFFAGSTSTVPDRVAPPPPRVTGTNPGPGLARWTGDLSPLGLEITGALTTTGATVTFTPAAPPTPENVELSFAAVPADGETITLQLRDRTGAAHTVVLTARNAPAGPNDFQIGADANATINGANGILAAAARALDAKAAEVLTVEESVAMETTSAARPTVIWYKGDDATVPSARDTLLLRIDTSQVIATGARANEDAITSFLASFGALAAVTFANTPAERDRYMNLATHARDKLSPPYGEQRLEELATDFGTALATMEGAKQRHKTAANMLQGALDKVELASTEETAAAMLSLQTRLQASYQTTSMLSRLSLVNFL